MREAFRYVMVKHPFEIDAIVLLPDQEYIHYNPVKHGLAAAPKDWTYSSFHRYVRRGVYAVAGVGNE